MTDYLRFMRFLAAVLFVAMPFLGAIMVGPIFLVVYLLAPTSEGWALVLSIAWMLFGGLPILFWIIERWGDSLHDRFEWMAGNRPHPRKKYDL